MELGLELAVYILTSHTTVVTLSPPLPAGLNHHTQ